MRSVNMLEARSSLSRLVDALERGVASEIVIARNGKPAARLVPIEPPAAGPRLGVAKGRFKLPESIDADNPAVASLFSGEDG
jgi:antitoxin (DNA-binding transcriptional repressor) of toxin-antitoxin stability system